MNSNNNKNEVKADLSPWYALRTFNCQEQKVSRFLTEKGCRHFIPMRYVGEVTDGEEKGNSKPKLVPAVHNLLFVQKHESQKHMLRLLGECNAPVSVFRQPGSQLVCEISARDMLELRILCDPDFKSAVFISQPVAEAMIGKDVRVVSGPFKGAIGKLVRKQKQYYFLKAVIGMGVMVRIPRWYCEPI